MSQSQMQEITCPKCGKKQFFRVWDSINTSLTIKSQVLQNNYFMNGM